MEGPGTGKTPPAAQAGPVVVVVVTTPRHRQQRARGMCRPPRLRRATEAVRGSPVALVLSAAVVVALAVLAKTRLLIFTAALAGSVLWTT